MPNKKLNVKLSVYDLYLKDSGFGKAYEAEQQEAMFEYVGEVIDYVALYDREMPKGFAISDLDENSTDISVIYLHDLDGELIGEEEILWDILGEDARSRIRELLGEEIASGRSLSLIYVDGYEDYEGEKVTKLLPLRRRFEI